jgi:competence ComEA-like helix-hairpin-helix protein
MPPGPDGIWTVSQRRGLIALLALVTALLAIRLIINRQYVADPEPAQGPAADQLQNRIDPNVADAAELSAIPGVGEKRAESIVEYRQAYLRRNPGKLPFAYVRDLERIPGIGPATCEAMEPYLFIQKPPATSF